MQRRDCFSLSAGVAVLLTLLLVGCGARRAASTPTPTPTPTPTRTVVRGLWSATAVAPDRLPMAATPTGHRPQATDHRDSAALSLRATEEAFAAASALERATYFHEVGDYVEAERLLKTLLADPQTTLAQRREGLYRLALAALAKRKPALALDALEQFALQDVSPPTSQAEAHRTGNSVFLRAEALAGLGLYAEAVAAYRSFLAQRPQAAGVVEEFIADAWLAAGEWSQAANALRRAADGAPDRGENIRLLERLAGVLQTYGRWDEAASVYDAILLGLDSDAAEGAAADFDDILGFRVRPVYRVGILYRAGAAYAAAGDEETAIVHWRMALGEDPASNAAYQSLIQLVNRNAPVDLFLRGEIDLAAQAYIPALHAFERFLEESPDDDRAGQAWLGIGRAHLALGQWEEAGRALDQAVNRYPTCACFGEVWLARARLAAAQGAPAAARRIYRTFARDYPDDALAPEALWLSALSALAEDIDLGAGPARHAGVVIDPFDEAVADLLRLVEVFPDSRRAADGLAVAGIGAFAHGRYAQAANNFARLRADYPDAQPDAAAYWLGRARHAQGEIDAARSLWQALAARQPETYYGVLAALALTPHPQWSAISDQRSAPPQATDRRQPATGVQPGQDLIARMGVFAAAAPALPDDDGSRAFAADWLASWHGAPDTTVTDDLTFIGGELLLTLGRRAHGLKLLERVYWRYRDDPAALFPLMQSFESLGVNRLAITAAYRIITTRRPDASDNASRPAGRIGEAPLFLQRAAYPKRFFRLVEKEAAAFDIDPLLLYSLIFQESLFEPPARSFAGAQGLTQIIPTTGAEIAQRLNYPNYATDLLNRPYVSVRFGAYYLRWVRDFARDNDVAALAGYNAGPGNARTWLDRTAPDDALFIELIPYDETRLYLQRILTHYYHYLRLYAR